MNFKLHILAFIISLLFAHKSSAQSVIDSVLKLDSINNYSSYSDSTGETDTNKVEYEYDQSIEYRKLDRNKWKKTIEDLNYDEKEKKNKKSDFKLNPNIFKLFDALKYISITLIAILVLFLIYIIVKKVMNEKSSEIKKDSELDIKTIDDIDEVEEIDFNKLLENALAENNFKNATRILYILLIKNLHVNKIIEWKKDKTNEHYSLEIVNIDLKLNFKSITYTYEKIWFGDYPINENEFNAIKNQFNELNNSINNTIKIEK